MLIFDRTQADVDAVIALKQKISTGNATQVDINTWNAGMKGALNATDFIRIYAEMVIIATETGTTIGEYTWSMGEYPSAEKIGRFISDVSALKNAVLGPEITVPSKIDSYQEQNQLENILQLIKNALSDANKSNDYCGDAYTGGY